MNLFKFLTSVFNETISIFKLHRDTGVPLHTKLRKILFLCLYVLMFGCCITLSVRAVKISSQFKEYRETHPFTAEECQSKNQPNAPSDSSLGIKVNVESHKHLWTTTQDCHAGSCDEHKTSSQRDSVYALKNRIE